MRKRPLKVKDNECHCMWTTVMLLQIALLCSHVNGLEVSPGFAVYMRKGGEVKEVEKGGGQGGKREAHHLMWHYLSCIVNVNFEGR